MEAEPSALDLFAADFDLGEPRLDELRADRLRPQVLVRSAAGDEPVLALAVLRHELEHHLQDRRSRPEVRLGMAAAVGLRSHYGLEHEVYAGAYAALPHEQDANAAATRLVDEIDPDGAIDAAIAFPEHGVLLGTPHPFDDLGQRAEALTAIGAVIGEPFIRACGDIINLDPHTAAVPDYKMATLALLEMAGTEGLWAVIATDPRISELRADLPTVIQRCALTLAAPWRRWHPCANCWREPWTMPTARLREGAGLARAHTLTHALRARGAQSSSMRRPVRRAPDRDPHGRCYTGFSCG